MMTDQNGRQLQRNVEQEPDGTWGCNVWFGDGLDKRRYSYRTRDEARRADISDDFETGVVSFGTYREARHPE